MRRELPPLPMPSSESSTRVLLLGLRQIVVDWLGAGKSGPTRRVVTFEDLIAAGLLSEETARRIAER
jgi:hypothetical protein